MFYYICLEFRNGRANILVATDVAARGLGKYFCYFLSTLKSEYNAWLQMLMMSNLLLISTTPTIQRIIFTELVELVDHHKRVPHMHFSPIPIASKLRTLLLYLPKPINVLTLNQLQWLHDHSVSYLFFFNYFIFN